MRTGGRKKLAQLFPLGAADPKLLALLKTPIYRYQAEGALFAVRAGRAHDRRRYGPRQDHTGDRLRWKYWHGILVSRKCW